MNPILECAKGEENDYSRFTVSKYITSKGIETNGNLKHPIALLTMDEVVMAGASGSDTTLKNVYYVCDAYRNNKSSSELWTMSPSGESDSTLIIYGDVVNLTHLNHGTYNLGGINPVINLRDDVLYAEGDGTSGSGAYTIKL